MTAWLWLLAIFLPGGSLIALAVWRRRRWIARDLADVNAAILGNAASYRFEGHDDALRVRTKAKRDTADRMKARARHVESGASAAHVLRMVQR